MQNEKITIVEKDNTEIEVNLITIFSNEEKTRKYLVYTKEEKQGANTIVYISILNENNGKKYLEEITDDAEWLKVKDIIRKLLAQ